MFISGEKYNKEFNNIESDNFEHIFDEFKIFRLFQEHREGIYPILKNNIDKLDTTKICLDNIVFSTTNDFNSDSKLSFIRYFSDVLLFHTIGITLTDEMFELLLEFNNRVDIICMSNSIFPLWVTHFVNYSRYHKLKNKFCTILSKEIKEIRNKRNDCTNVINDLFDYHDNGVTLSNYEISEIILTFLYMHVTEAVALTVNTMDDIYEQHAWKSLKEDIKFFENSKNMDYIPSIRSFLNESTLTKRNIISIKKYKRSDCGLFELNLPDYIVHCGSRCLQSYDLERNQTVDIFMKRAIETAIKIVISNYNIPIYDQDKRLKMECSHSYITFLHPVFDYIKDSVLSINYCNYAVTSGYLNKKKIDIIKITDSNNEVVGFYLPNYLDISNKIDITKRIENSNELFEDFTDVIFKILDIKQSINSCFINWSSNEIQENVLSNNKFGITFYLQGYYKIELNNLSINIKPLDVLVCKFIDLNCSYEYDDNIKDISRVSLRSI